MVDLDLVKPFFRCRLARADLEARGIRLVAPEGERFYADLPILLPEARGVKAFNTLFASNQADPTVDGVTLDGFVAGDDPTAKSVVLELVESMGLNPVDVGPLVRARQLESLAFLNIALQLANHGAWHSGWKLVAAPATLPAAA